MTFTFVGGNLALDFAGTLQHRATTRDEMLSSPERFGEWSVAAGLVDEPPAVSEAGLARAFAVREAIYRLAVTAVTGDPRRPGDIDLVNSAAAGAPVTAVLTGTGVRREGTEDEAIATVARAAIGLLGGPDRARIKECADLSCTRLFVDASRAASRHWCDMRGCGNRSKVAGHRARHAAAPRPPRAGSSRLLT
jgi:predicted RNA-binding Zn ribbon-like protein